MSFPTGSSDYFDQTYVVAPGIGNVADGIIAGRLPLTGISVSVADFGSGRTYPRVGVYRSNLALGPGGETPDLARPLVEITSPSFTPPPLFELVPFDTAEGDIANGDTRVHAVVQLPPGDSGLLGIGADSASTGTTGGLAGFTTDGYTTPSIAARSSTSV